MKNNTAAFLSCFACIIILLATFFLQIIPARAETYTQPGINKEFQPISISAGGISKLVVTIYNPNLLVMSLSSSDYAFNDTLPAGMFFSSPANVVNTCGGTVTLIGTTLTLIGGSVPAQVLSPGSCSVTVDVTSSTPGNLVNSIPIGNLTGTINGNVLHNPTEAKATLAVNPVLPPSLSKTFAPNTIWVGQNSVMTLRLRNTDTGTALTKVSITDNLPSGLTIASAAPTQCGGTVTTTASSVTLTNGTVPKQAGTIAGICDIVVNVTSTTPGVYTNLIPANSIVSQQGATNASAASAPLNVQAISVGKTFSPSSVQVGGTSTLTITLNNPSGSDYTSAAITDNLPAGLTIFSAPASPQCGGTVTSTSSSVTLSGGTIPAVPGSCTITATVTTAIAASYTNTIPAGALSAKTSVGNTVSNVLAATAYIGVYGNGYGLGASKGFNPATIAVGGTSRLTINIAAPADTQLTNFNISDALPTGVVVSATPNPVKNGNCQGGTFAPTAGSVLITYTGGTIPIGSTCSLAVNVTSSIPDLYTNWISPANISNTQNRNTSGNIWAQLTVSGISVVKSFDPPTVNPGGGSTLTITLGNTNLSQLDGVTFTDKLPGTSPNNVEVDYTALPGNLPIWSTTCAGANLSVAADKQTILVTDATVPAQVAGVPGICTIIVDVIGLGSPATYTNTIAKNGVSGTVHGTSVVVTNPSAASSDLTVNPITISINKGFSPVSISGNSSSTLSLELTNPQNTLLTGIAFTDNLPQALTGPVGGMMVAPVPNISLGTCGGSLVAPAGAKTISYSGGSLLANSKCTITLSVTMDVENNLTNTIEIGEVTTSNGASNPQKAEASLTNLPGVSISKIFNRNPILFGEVSTLTFTIQNTGNISLTGMGFSDTFPGSLVIAPTPNASTTCNPSAGGTPVPATLIAEAGTDIISLSGGAVVGLASCTVQVDVTGPVGTYANVVPNGGLSALTPGGATVNNSEPAADTLVINAVVRPAVISKLFSTNPMLKNGTSALIFTIINPHTAPNINVVALTGVGFTDTFPAGLVLASVPNAVQCGGILSSTADSITLTGGTIATGGSCTVTVSVTSAMGGTYVNTSDNVTSANGGQGNTATETLTVIAPPQITKAFSTQPITTPATINVGNTSTLTFTITNPAENTVSLTGVAVTDILPFGLEIVPGTKATTCTTGVLSETTSQISISGAQINSGAVCTITVDVKGLTGGTFQNTTQAVTSTNGGTGNTASDQLIVNGPGLSLVKSTITTGFQAVGDPIAYTYLLSNTGNVNLYPPFAVTDDKVASVSCPATPNPLLPDGTVTCTATYLAVSADVTAKSVTNTALATAMDAETGGNPVTSNQSSVTVNLEALSLRKTTTTTGYRVAGNKIDYQYTLTNTGLVTLYPPYTVTDNKVTVTCPGTPAMLPPGMNVSCSAQYTVAAADLVVPPGAVINTATGYAKDEASGGATVISNQSSVTVYLVSPPSITKEFVPAVIAAGTSSVLTFTITNPVGNVIPLFGVGFSDIFPAGMTVAQAPLASQCGGSVTYTSNSITLSGGTVITDSTCTVEVTVTAADRGSYSNTSGLVTATNGGTGNTASAVLDVVVPPTISKEFLPTSILKDGVSKITFVITNPNLSTTINGIAFSDSFPAGLEVASTTGLQTPTITGCGAVPVFTPALGDISLSFSGGSIVGGGTCTLTVYVTGKTGGDKVNITGPITSTEGGPGVPSNVATLSVDVPEITLVKSITSGNPFKLVGDVVNYSYLLTNTGTVTLVGAGDGGVFTVSDDKAAVVCPATPSGLVPNATVTCTGSYIITQPDLDYGSVTNTARAHGKFGSVLIDSNFDSQMAKATPQLAKVFTATEISNINNLDSEVAIGERVNYTLTLSVPKGSTPSGVLTDVLDAGLSFLDIQSVTYSPTVTSVNTIVNESSTGVNVSSTGGGTNNQVVINFGNITNSSSDYTTQQTIIIAYRAVAGNVLANQSGTLLNNSASFAWTSDSVNQTAATAEVKVIEPTLGVLKAIVGNVGKDAGDTTTFSITVSNGNASTDTDGFDVVLLDNMPAGLTLVTPVDKGTCTTADFSGSTSSVLSGSWGIFAKNSSCSFTIDTILANNVLPGQSIAANTAEVRWTSISGARTEERSGPTGAIGSDPLNDYGAASSTTAFLLDNVTSKKVIVATSEAHTTDPNVAIGEIARYRLVMQLPESTVQNLQFSDLFTGTGGQRFLNDGTARALIVGGTSIASDAYDTGSEIIPAVVCTPNKAGAFTIDQAADPAIISSASVNCPLADLNISDNGFTNSDTYNINSSVFFKFGTVTNINDDLNAEFLIVEFNALVTNEAANIDGNTLTDSFIGKRWNSTTSAMVNMGTAAPAVSLTVREPAVTVTKVLSGIPHHDAGDTVTYDLTITAGGTATAFDLELIDTLVAGLTPVSQVINSTTQAATCSGDGVGTTAFADQISRSGQVVTLSATCLDPGQSITATITAKVVTGAAVGSTIPNTADLTYTSLPDIHGTTTNDTGSAVTAAPGAVTGERTGAGTAPNTYTSTDTAAFTLDLPGMVKTDAASANYTIGQTVTYDIRVTLPEGVTPSLVVTDNIPAGIKPTGSLPYGLKYVSSQVFNSEFSGSPDITLVSGVCANTCAAGDDVTFTFGDVTTNDDNVTTNNTIIIRVVLLVENLPGNQDRIPSNSEYPTSLINAASATYTGGTMNSSAAAVSVVEPRITTTKSADLTTNIKSGVTINYTVTFTNTGDSTAYDVTALDTMAQGMSFGTITSCVSSVNGGAEALIGFTQPPAGITSVPFDSSPAGIWDIPATATDSYIKCVYTGIAGDSLILNGSHTNSADADWTSLDGAASGERNYNDGTIYNFDGTQDTATASFTTGVPTLSKSDGGVTQKTIGDEITYTITVGGAGVEGTLRSLVVTDTLPAGLVYDSGTVVGSNGLAITGLSGTPTVNVSNPNNGSAAVTVTFTFGDTLKSIDNATIVFNAHVADVTGNAKGVTKTNSVSASYLNVAGGTVNLGPATDGFTIIEPVITTSKSANASANVKAGDTLTYTVRFTNTGNSPAYDVTALDTMAPGVVFGAISSCNYYNGATTAGIGFTQPTAGITSVPFEGDTAGIWDLPATTLKSYIECVYTGIVQNGMILNGNHTNSIDADWTSQDGTGNANERTYVDGVSRVGVDGTQDTATWTFTTGTPTLSKSDGGVTQKTIGDEITYTITVGGAGVEGTLRSLVVTDTLPAGLTYDGGVLVNGLSIGTLVTSTNTVGAVTTVTFTFGDTVKSADNATITFNTHVADDTVNFMGAAKLNSVRATYLDIAGTTVNLGPATDGYTIIEPVITTTKLVDKTANVKAGDTINYTVRFTNTGDSPAYDVTALDVMAQGVKFDKVNSCSSFDGLTSTPINATTAVTEDGSGLDNIVLDGDPAGTGAWDILSTAPDSYIECVYSGIAQSNLYLDGNHTNTIDADWTSQDGTFAGERVYADGPTPAAVDGTQDTAQAVFSAGAPTISKAADILNPAIGQTVHFTLTINSPLGTVLSAKVVDLLPAGYIYTVNTQSVSAGVTAATFSSMGSTDGTGAVTLTWDFGNAVVTTSPFTIEYDVVVANVAANQNYTELTNTATLSYAKADAVPQSATPSSVKTTIIEPILTIGKTAVPAAATLDASDEVNYTITIAHDATSTATANEVNFTDVLPVYATLKTGSVQVNNVGPLGTVTTTDTSNTVKVDITNIPVGTTVTITYTATLTPDVTPKQKLENTGVATWTSLSGDIRTGAFNGERDGSGGVNDYTTSATATLYADDLLPVKSIVSTSEVHTPETGNGSNGTTQARELAIGEIMRYQMDVTVPEGTLAGLTFADTLPTGLSYLGNPTIMLVSDVAMTAAADFSGAQNAVIPMLPAYVTVVGQDVTFTAGNIVNNDSDAGAEKVIVEFDVLVNNTSDNIKNSTIHNNAFTAVVSGGTAVTSNHIYSKVVEPSLLLGKTASALTNWKYNDTVTYTLSISTPISSTAAAFDLRVTDTIPAGLTYVPLSISQPTNWTADASAGPALVWTCAENCLTAGAVDFTYQVTVDAPPAASALSGDATVTNIATLTYTSLPGTKGTGSVTPGDSGDVNGERNGSAVGVNNYTDPAQHTGGITPYYALGNRVWFDTSNNGVMDSGEAGVDGVVVQLYAAADTTFSTPLATDTTKDGGFYLFDYLEPGSYVVVIPASNFVGNSKLVGYWSSKTSMRNDGLATIDEVAAVNVDIVATDADDNGTRQTADPLAGAVITLPITLGGTEPTGEAAAQLRAGVGQGAQPDNRANMTADFGFYRTEVGGVLWTEGGTVVDGQYVALDDGLISNNPVRLYTGDGVTEIKVGPDGIWQTADDLTGSLMSGAGGDYVFSGLPAGKYVIKISETVGMISTIDTVDQTDNNNPNTNTDSNDNGDNHQEGSGLVASNPVDTQPGLTGAKGNNAVTNLTGTTTDLTLDFGFAARYALGDRLWLDTNNDGLQNGVEVGAPGVTVQLFAANGLGQPTGAVLAPDVTDAAGYFLFDNLFPGDYVVVVPASNFTGGGKLVGYWSSRTTMNPDNSTSEIVPSDPDNNVLNDDNGKLVGSDVISDAITLGPIGGTEPVNEIVGQGSQPDDHANMTLDFGFFRPAIISDFVWYDSNYDGIQDAGETGINGAAINLYSGAGSLITSTTTDASGLYRFTNLVEGDYYVVFTLPTGYVFSPKNAAGSTAANDSNADPDTGQTATVMLVDGETNNTIDAGMYIANPVLTLLKSTTSLGYSAVGDVLSYNFNLKNDGNVTLFAPYTVTDDRTTVSCPATPVTIAMNESVDCTSTYAITQADLDAGTVTNTASATAKDKGGVVITSNIDSVTVTGTQTKTLTLKKTTTSLGYNAVGNTLSYSYNLKNDGNVTLYAPYTVSDNKTPVSCPATPVSIAPTTSVDCTATYTITQADLDAGSVTNTASAKAKDKASGGADVSSNIDFVTVTGTQSPAMTVVKSSLTTGLNVPAMVTYSYLVTNTGNVTLTGIALSDDNDNNNMSCPVTTLAPTAAMTCSATHTFTQAELDANGSPTAASGKLTNTVTANSTQTATATDTLNIPITQTPAMTVVKSSLTTSLSSPGTVTYSYLVTNSGNLTLTGIGLSDDNDNNDMSCPATTLAPAGTMTCSATHTFTQAELDANGSPTALSGRLTNTVTASSNEAPNATDTLNIPITYTATMTVLKSSLTTGLNAPGTVTYSYLVTNTGNVTLTGIALSDDNDNNDMSCPATTLAPAGTMTCSATHTFTQAELDANGSPTALSGKLTNTVTASSTEAPNATSTLNIPITYTATMTVLKSSLTTGLSAPGIVTYSYVVTNTGNVTLTGIALSDDNDNNDMSCPATTLAPSVAMTCSATHTFTQAELDANGSPTALSGKLTNTVTASSIEAPNATSTLNIPITYTATMTVLKSSLTTSLNAPGTVTYSYLVTNTGNVTLTGIALSDDNDNNDMSCPATTLAPAGTMNCSATHTFTLVELDANGSLTAASGNLTNTVTVSSNEAPNATDTLNIPLTQSPSLGIVKTALPATYNAVGDVIGYSFEVTNTGNVTLYAPFTVADDKAGDESCPATPVSLAPNGMITCTASYTITLADLDAGSVTNTARATGKDAATNGNDVTSAQDTATVTAVQSPSLGMVKTALPTTYNALGDVIGYSYEVTNTGNVTLYAPFTVDDDKAADEACPATPVSLAPGDKITCTASYTITQVDLDAGSVTNVASVSSGTTTSPTDTATVNAVQSPSITIKKSANPLIYFAPGNVINYSYLVSNNGNVTLYAPISVADDRAADEACPTGNLAPGGTMTCSATYSITQGDLDAGSVTNIASASGKDSGGRDITSATDTVTVNAIQNPVFTILKSETIPGTYIVGDTIPYDIVVKNTGNVTLTSVVVSDNSANVGVCSPAQPASLAPGAKMTCPATHTVSQADVNIGSYVNTATADSDQTLSLTSTVTVNFVAAPALTIVKTATPATYSAVGDVISYSYLLTNTGNVSLYGLFTVADDKAADEACAAGDLTPGASMTCTASYTITQGDLNAGTVTNVASATGKDPGGKDVTSATDSETVSAVQNPVLGIVKTAAPATYSVVGDVISYSYALTNNGNVTLYGLFTVADDKATDEACPAGDLVPGASMTCTASYTITQGDLDAGSVTNIASATGKDLNGKDVTSATDTRTVTASQGPALSIVKTASPLTYSALNDVINYSYLLTNNGNVTLYGLFTVADDRATDEACPAGNLMPGASMTCTATYSIRQADLDAGSVMNIASATGKDPNGKSITSATDTETVTASQGAALSIVKTASPLTYSAVNDVISYSYEVTNSGNVTLYAPFSVADDKATDEACTGAPASLAPGGKLICTASYTITLADLNAGSVTNIASATGKDAGGTDVNSATDTATVTASQNPALTIIKTASPLTYSAVNDVISYSYEVTNSGNVTLYAPFSVADDKASDEACTGAPASLAPTEKLNCTASYSITQADLDAGSVTNIASATGKDGGGKDVTSATDSATVTGHQSAALKMEKKETSKGPYLKNGTVTYDIVVTNTGNVSLTNLTVADDSAVLGTCVPAQPGSLLPGESMTCAATHVVTQSDIEKGSYTNIASADSVETEPGTSTVTVPVTAQPMIGIAKQMVSSTKVSAGVYDVTFNMLVENYGNVDLSDLQVTDDLAAVFTLPTTFTVQSVSSADFKVNSAYNGGSDINLLQGTDTLVIGGKGSLQLVVRVVPTGIGPFNNAAIASGVPPVGDPLVDNSQDGVDPDQDGDGNPTNNDDPTPVNFAAGIFDPPLGIKLLDDSGLPVLKWTMIWINETNIPELNARVSDPVPAGTSFSPTGVQSGYAVPVSAPVGSSNLGIECKAADGAVGTTTSLCYYEGPTGEYSLGRIVWEGTLGPDLGAVDATTAKNEIYIRFNLTLGEGVTSVLNVASIDADLNNNDVFIDPGESNAASARQEWQGKAVFSRSDKPDKLPATGFAPGLITMLPEKSTDWLYGSYGNLKIEIPGLKVTENIVGVPYVNGQWDLSWLGSSAGYLNGTAFPTWKGNSVITAHVYLSNGLPGPFVDIGKLKWGDRVNIRAFGQKYVYEVRSTETVKPDDVSVLGHKDQAWVTLITCKEFNARTGQYRMRTAVQAVLIAVFDDEGIIEKR